MKNKVKHFFGCVCCCVAEFDRSNQPESNLVEDQVQSNISNSVNSSKKLSKKLGNLKNSKEQENTMSFKHLGDFGISGSKLITKNNEKKADSPKQKDNGNTDQSSLSTELSISDDSEEIGTRDGDLGKTGTYIAEEFAKHSNVTLTESSYNDGWII